MNDPGLNRKHESCGTIRQYKNKLDDHEDKMRKDAIAELVDTRPLFTNPMVIKLQSSLIDILNTPTVPSNRDLIKYLLDYCPVTPGETPVSEFGPDRSTASLDPDGASASTSSAPVASTCQTRTEPTSSQTRPSRPQSTLTETLELGIHSSQVHWDNDYNFVRFYLPVDSRVVTLEMVTCNMLHLELGHRLNVEYSGVKFSVLISHPSIKGTVEGRIAKNATKGTKLIIRLAKTKEEAWSHVTFLILDSENSSLHLNLTPHSSFRWPQTYKNMMSIHENGPNSMKIFSSSSMLKLGDKENLDEDHIQFLDSIRQSKFKARIEKGKYNVLGQCSCDSCRNYELASSDTSFNQVKRLHICDVWWSNDEESASIFLKRPPNITDGDVKFWHHATDSGEEIRVRFPGTSFLATIIHDLAPIDPVKVTFEEDRTIAIKLKKKTKGFWQFISPLTKNEEDGSVMYHLNKHYHLKVKRNANRLEKKSLKECFGLYMDGLNAYGLNPDEIKEIFEDAMYVHQLKVDESSLSR